MSVGRSVESVLALGEDLSNVEDGLDMAAITPVSSSSGRPAWGHLRWPRVGEFAVAIGALSTIHRRSHAARPIGSNRQTGRPAPPGHAHAAHGHCGAIYCGIRLPNATTPAKAGVATLLQCDLTIGHGNLRKRLHSDREFHLRREVANSPNNPRPSNASAPGSGTALIRESRT